MTLDELLDSGERHARNVLIEKKERQLMPLFHIVKADGGSFVLAAPWPNAEAKHALADALREVMRETAVQAYLFMSEAWIAIPPEGWTPDDRLPVMPSQDPKRKECVILSACSANRETLRLLEIKRGSDGVCMALERDDQLTPMGVGAFSNLLRRDA